jgi:hypothetical protein
MPFDDDALTNQNRHFFTFRPFPHYLRNLGYFRTKTPLATITVFENLAKAFTKNGATIRVWHTKRLWITWEGKSNA